MNGSRNTIATTTLSSNPPPFSRMGCKMLVEREYSNTKIKWLGRLDIGIIIEVLYLADELTDKEKTDIDNLRGRRNDVIHATGATPTEGETRRAMDLALLLHSKE